MGRDAYTYIPRPDPIYPIYLEFELINTSIKKWGQVELTRFPRTRG